MANHKNIAKRVLAAVTVAASSFCVFAEPAALVPSQIDGRQTGIYAYNPTTWTPEVASAFPLVVVQYHGWAPDPAMLTHVKDLASNGSRVLIDFEFLKTASQRRGIESAPQADEIVTQAGAMIDGLAGVPIEGISIDEENKLDSSRIALLTDVYKRLKQKYPAQHFLQWVSAGSYRLPSLGSDLASIPADGWIVDAYNLTMPEYEKFLAQFRAVSGRVYSVIWAAPGQRPDIAAATVAQPAFWNSRWANFYVQIAYNRSIGVPTIFYLYGLSGSRAISLWTSNYCDKEYFSSFVKTTVPFIRSHALSTEAPAEKPQWLPDYCVSGQQVAQ